MICLKQTYARKAPPQSGAFRVRGEVPVDAESIPQGKALTTTEAAELAGVAQSTIRMWVARGKLKPAGHDPAGRALYWQTDVARAERSTRKGARRNVGLRTVATQDIADDEAVLVRLHCGHLKILSVHHRPESGRAVACFECASEAAISHPVQAGRAALTAA